MPRHRPPAPDHLTYSTSDVSLFFDTLSSMLFIQKDKKVTSISVQSRLWRDVYTLTYVKVTPVPTPPPGSGLQFGSVVGPTININSKDPIMDVNTLVDNQKTTARIIPEDPAGKTIALPDGVTVGWTSSDSSIGVATPAADGLSCDIQALAATDPANGNLGPVTLTATATDQSGTALAVKIFNFNVVGGNLTQFGGSVDAPTDVPAAA